MAKKSHCWLGRHKWVKRETTDGDVHGECTRCGKRDWGRFAQSSGRDGGAPVHEGSMGIWVGQPPSPSAPEKKFTAWGGDGDG
jgi:hypothetical protein